MAKKPRGILGRNNRVSAEQVLRQKLAEVGYTIVVFDCWSANLDRNDPATGLERRLAIFLPGAEPKNGKLPLKEMDRWSYSSDGYLEGAFSEEIIEVLRSPDSDAQRHLSDQENALNMGKRYNYQTNQYEDAGSDYEKFLDAIDRVAEHDDDEEAWEAIDKWRLRRIRSDEDRARRLG